jgi:hypothetical protein
VSEKPSEKVWALCDEIKATTRGPSSEILAELLLAALPQGEQTTLSNGMIIDALEEALDYICSKDAEALARFEAALKECREELL